MSDAHWLLPALLVWPLLGVLAVLVGGEGAASAAAARRAALAVLIGEVVLAVGAVAAFDPATPGFQLRVTAPWLPGLGAAWRLGVDGLSLLFLPATVLLFLAVVLASWRAAGTRPRLYFVLLLLQLAATLLVFMALDTLLFFFAWELSLVPFYFLTVRWGVGPGRRFTASKYTLIMLASGIPLLLAFLLAGRAASAATGGDWVFDLTQLMAMPADAGLQSLLLLLLVLGLAAKTPMFPLHTWLPALAQEGPVPAGALLVGLKLGAFALLRLAVPLAPAALAQFAWVLAAVGVVGLLYGAVAAVAQTNLRRTLAYASLSHVGLVLLGLAAGSAAGVRGAAFQVLNFTYVAGGLFVVSGFMHRRLGSTDTLHMGGLVHTMPRLAFVFACFAVAGIGVPGSATFPAELLLLTSALHAFPGAGMAALFAGVIGAAYLLGALRKAFFGPQPPARPALDMDLQRHEVAAVLVLLLPTLAFGAAPGWVLDLIGQAATALPGR